ALGLGRMRHPGTRACDASIPVRWRECPIGLIGAGRTIAVLNICDGLRAQPRAARKPLKGNHMASNLHGTSIVIDGLIISDFGRSVFEDMRKGGLTAANCTCCVWEGFTETMRNVTRWKAWFREHG